MTLELISFLPPGVSLLAAVLVIITAFLAAALTAAVGIGGGLVLIAIMTALMPIAAVVPVHGVAQLGSNGARVVLQLRHVIWPVLGWFTLGGLAGVLLGGQIAVSMPAWVLQTGIACFIFASVWGPKMNVPKPGPRAYMATGVVGTFLTLFFGATGPVVATVINRAELDRFQTIGTHGACMFVQHLLKVLTFGVLGFSYGVWLPMIIAIVLAGFVGTWVGTRILNRLPEATFKRGFKYALTIMAVYLFISGVRSYFTGAV